MAMEPINNLGVPVPGSNDDVYNRLLEQLPPWFGTDHPNLDTTLQAFINTATFHYAQYLYVALQQRLQTATDVNLDLISQDYLGNELPRRLEEGDDLYRSRIYATLLRPKATRPAMQNGLFLLTGIQPKIFEPWNGANCGGYNDYQALAYNTIGSYGSGSFAYQCFIDVYVNAFSGMASWSGYNGYFGGYNAYGTPAVLWYGGESLNENILTDDDIYRFINLTKVEGTVCWVKIHRILVT